MEKRGLGDSLSAANVAGSELSVDLLLNVNRHTSLASRVSPCLLQLPETVGCSGSRRVGSPTELVGFGWERLRARKEGPPFLISILRTCCSLGKEEDDCAGEIATKTVGIGKSRWGDGGTCVTEKEQKNRRKATR